MINIKLITLLLLLGITCTGLAAEGDWPTWRGDASRTGASSNPLPNDLSLLWHQSMGYPDAAFIHQVRMCADATYAPVAASGLVFIPSNLRDEVTALDLATGDTVWRYVTEGPVRFSPVFDNGKLYFGSDDGMLYCLQAASGELLWKVRGAPEHLPTSKLLINGRLCSRWPVRGAPVLHQGKLFFGAGIWPEEGVYVTAIDAETGELAWRTDALSLQKGGMNDHSQVYDLGLPPQGYLAIINGQLAVPSGRSLALFLDPETGTVEPYNCYYSKHNQPRGTWWLSGNSDYWIQGGCVFGTTANALAELPPETMDLETFAGYADKSPAETLALLKKLSQKDSLGKPKRIFGGVNRITISETNGKTTIQAPLHSQSASGTYAPRFPTEAELYNYENRPLLNADIYRLHNEVHYTEPVLNGDVLYNSILDDPTGYLVERGHTYVDYPQLDRIVARDMSDPRWKLHLDAYHIVRRLEFPVIWELETPHKVLIASGDKIVAGIPGEVIAIKDAGGEPTITFRAKIDGAPVNALVSNGRLIVASSTGKVYCFGSGEPTLVPDQPIQQDTVFGKQLLPGFPEGYALVLGWGDGTEVKRLLDGGKHQIVVIEPNEVLADQQRRNLATRGLYGRQIQIVTADPAQLMLSPYWANLVVSQNLAPFAASLPRLALDTVRPYTGKLRIPKNDKAASIIRTYLEGADGSFGQVSPLSSPAASTSDLPASERVTELQEDVLGKEAVAGGFTTATATGDSLEFCRTSPPAGYDDWTHETAGPGNTFASRDALVKAPLGLLWFSGYIDRFYTPEFHFQHDRAPYPLVSNGRMFLITGQTMNAVDIYTGNFLWKIEMPMTQRVEWRYMDSRVYSRPYERNYIATPDILYIIYEQEIHLISTADGEKLDVFTIPKAIASASDDSIWTEVRLAGDHLCCVLGETLACLDRRTGNLLWQRDSTLDSTSYALGDAALFGVDYTTPPGVYRGEATSQKRSLLFRLDLATGQEAWTATVEHATVPEQNPKQRKPWLLPITPSVIYNAKHQKAIVVVNRMTYYGFDAKDGTRAWEHQGDQSGNRFSLHLAPMPLVADDILFGSTADYKSDAVVLDVRTGEVIDNGTWLDYKRGCSRVIGNGNLLTYRNAATEVFDYQNKTRLNFNSVRAGCTANFLPAGGVLNAPSFGHGCVCNYPTFASLAMVHLPAVDTFKPASVKSREEERSKPTPDGTSETGEQPALPLEPMDLSVFKLTDATIESAKGGCIFRTTGDGIGFAIRKAPEAMTTGRLTFFFQGIGGNGRHKNSFLVLGPSNDPEDWIQVMLYHGGRKRLMISGKHVEEQEVALNLPPQGQTWTKASVHFDLAAKAVSVTVADTTLTSKITNSIPSVTHFGYGGSNSDTLATEIGVDLDD